MQRGAHPWILGAVVFSDAQITQDVVCVNSYDTRFRSRSLKNRHDIRILYIAGYVPHMTRQTPVSQKITLDVNSKTLMFRWNIRRFLCTWNVASETKCKVRAHQQQFQSRLWSKADRALELGSKADRALELWSKADRALELGSKAYRALELWSKADRALELWKSQKPERFTAHLKMFLLISRLFEFVREFVSDEILQRLFFCLEALRTVSCIRFWQEWFWLNRFVYITFLLMLSCILRVGKSPVWQRKFAPYATA